MNDDDKDAELYQFTPPPPRPGGAPRKPRRRRLTKTAAGLAVILGAGAGGAAVASATSAGPASNTPAASAPAPGTNSSRGPGGLRRGFLPPGPGGPMAVGPIGGFGMGLGGAIHGSFTVKGPSGTYETIDTQYGTAEAVSSSSITVKSADGFSQSYSVDSSTIVDADPSGILSVKVGDTVSIQGLVSGSTVKAERVLDVTQVKAHHPSWGPATPPGLTAQVGREGRAAREGRAGRQPDARPPGLPRDAGAVPYEAAIASPHDL